MASGGVNVKMGVSGVAQFKSSINQAKQNMKTLDAQLALTEKQYKATGDAETYMQQKTEQLRSKLEEQKAVAANAEKALKDMTDRGVDKSSKAFQDMLRTLVQVKGDMLDTENALKNVADSSDDAGDNVSEMNQQLKRIGDGVNFQNVTTGLGKITTGLENAAKKAISLGKKIFDAMMGAGSYADDLTTRASVYGLSRDELQRMDKTARLIDTSVDAIVNAQKKLKKGLGSADQGVMGAFAELMGEGYNPKGRGWENAFWDAGEALMKFTDEEEKEVYAQRLFGRSWSELVPLFEAGREEYEKTNASWKVLSDEQLDSLGKMDDEYQKLQANVEQLKMSLLAEFAEPMASLLETINEQVNKFSEWLSSDDGQAFVNNVVSKVKEAMEWIAEPENIQRVIDAVKTIIAGWAGLKLVGGGLQMLQLISGAKGLLGGGAGAGAAGAGAGSAASGAATAAGAGAASRLLTGAQTAAFALPIALGLDGIIRDQKLVAEATERGAQAMQQAEEYQRQHAGSELLDEWETFNNYTTMPTAGRAEGMQAFAERFMAWVNGEVEDATLDLLTDDKHMTWEEFEALYQSMEDILNGTNHYSNEEIEAFTDPLIRMQEIIEDEMAYGESVKEGGKNINDAAKDMSRLPGQTAAAVSQALNGASVVIDGEALTAVVGELMARYVTNS